MKPSLITKASVSSVKGKMLQPFRIATGENAFFENIFFSIELADGTKGYGEAAVAEHITGEKLEITLCNLKKTAAWLIGHSASDYLKISTALQERLPLNHSAVAAVEIALFDAITRSLKIPLWRLWGAHPKKLRSDITIVIADLEETEEKTRLFYKQGFRSFKIKIGQDMDLDIKRIQAVQRITRGAAILLDANQGYKAEESIQILKYLKRHEIVPTVIEQPVEKNDDDGLQKVKRATQACVCADESASSLAHVLELIKKKSVGAINIKLMKTGLIHALEIAHWTKAHGLKLMIGGMVESNLSMTTAAHIAAGLGYFDFIDLDTPFFIEGEVALNPFLNNKGVYDLTTCKAGVGITPKKSSNTISNLYHF